MLQNAKGRRSRSKADLRRLNLVPIEDTPAEVFVAQLRGESDRGAILLMASYIEDTMTQRLREELLSADESQEEKLFGLSGIIGTFAAKTTMLVALGIITPTVGKLIDHVRLIRNAAAHVTANVTFESSLMKDAVRALLNDESQKLVDEATAREVRDIFVIACMILQQLAGERLRSDGTDEFRRTFVTTASETLDLDGGLPFSRMYCLRSDS